MNHPWKRILSGSIAAIGIVWAFLAGAGFAVVPVAVFDVIALILIWNSDDLGSTLIGFTTSPTPGWIISIAGWIVLSLPIIVLLHKCFH